MKRYSFDFRSHPVHCLPTLKRALAYLLLLIFLLTIHSFLWAQSEYPDSSTTPFHRQQQKFLRFLRAKYAALDSMARLRNGYLSPNIQFQFFSPKLGDFDVNRFGNPEYWQSGVNKDNWLRAHGGYQSVYLGPAQILAAFQKQSAWERGRREFDRHLIPSDLQLNVMNTLWQNHEATQQDIYAELSGTYAITAEKLDRQLDRMVDLGLLERKIISPQNLFTILTPLKSFQIEMSSKNRRNRIYLYRARVDRKEILQLLFARLDQVKNMGMGDADEKRRLSQKLKIVLSKINGL